MTSNRPILGENMRNCHVKKAALTNELEEALIQRFSDSAGDVGKENRFLWVDAYPVVDSIPSKFFERPTPER